MSPLRHLIVFTAKRIIRVDSFAEDAEKRCEASISSALRVDPASLDALQAMGSLRLSQNRKADACSAMEGVYSRIKTIRDKLRSRTVIDDLTEAKDDEYTEDMEGMQF